MNKSLKLVCVGLIPRTNSDGKIEYLFVSSKHTFGEYTGLFYPPGGHVEKGEDLEDALKRELIEELGIEVDIEKKLGETPGDVDNQLTIWYMCKEIPLHAGIKYDKDEIAAAIWIREDELQNNKEMLWPATYKFLMKYYRK